MKSPVKLFIADDHQLLIDGLISFFEKLDHVKVVGAANDGLTLLSALKTLQPDILLLDLNMPRMDGLSALKQVKEQYPAVAVLVLSNYHQSQLIHECEAKGASGYLLKNGSKEDLLSAIDLVKQGKKVFPVTEEVQPPNDLFVDSFMKRFGLTVREIDIIKLLRQEYNSRQIADRLYISEFTVNTHRRNIMRKLDVRNTTGVINFAVQNGIQ